MKKKKQDLKQRNAKPMTKVKKRVLIIATCGLLVVGVSLTVLFVRNHQNKETSTDITYNIDVPRQNLLRDCATLPAGDQVILDAIDDKMTQLAMYAQSRKAQIIYRMGFTEKAAEYSNFASKLAQCFGTSDQTNEELLTAVKDAFDVDINLEDFNYYVNSLKEYEVITDNFTDPSTKNNLDLAAFATNAYKQGWGYVYGGCGEVLDQVFFLDRQTMYPDNINMYYDFIQGNWMYGRVVDCVGLIKAYGWLDPKTGVITSNTNGMPDIDANGIYQAATVKGKMNTMPDTPGLAVWMNNHIGVYIGNGKVVEAMGTEYGVVKSDSKTRGWKGWCEIPYITYVGEK